MPAARVGAGGGRGSASRTALLGPLPVPERCHSPRGAATAGETGGRRHRPARPEGVKRKDRAGPSHSLAGRFVSGRRRRRRGAEQAAPARPPRGAVRRRGARGAVPPSGSTHRAQHVIRAAARKMAAAAAGPSRGWRGGSALRSPSGRRRRLSRWAGYPAAPPPWWGRGETWAFSAKARLLAAARCVSGAAGGSGGGGGGSEGGGDGATPASGFPRGRCSAGSACRGRPPAGAVRCSRAVRGRSGRCRPGGRGSARGRRWACGVLAAGCGRAPASGGARSLPRFKLAGEASMRTAGSETRRAAARNRALACLGISSRLRLCAFKNPHRLDMYLESDA